MKVAIHQPNYLPWLGYFHKILNADVFVFLDTVQLPRGKSYCNRVQIKSPQGKLWLTVPVKGKGERLPINQVSVENLKWRNKHLKTLQSCYGRAPFFYEVLDEIKPVYEQELSRLANINQQLIRKITSYLKGETVFMRASDLNIDYSPGNKYLIDIILTVGGDCYLSGQGAGSLRYVDAEDFRRTGIEVEYQQFNHPVYSQLWGEFEKGCSVIDLLFNEGPEARKIILEGGN